MGDVSAGALQAGVAVVDPYPHTRAGKQILRHERYLGKFFLEIFIDDRRFIDHGIPVHEHGHFPIRIALQKFFGFVAEIAFDELIRNLLFRQDKPCPVGVGSRTVGKQPHTNHLRFCCAFYHLDAGAANSSTDDQATQLFQKFRLSR
jgi:hypothetical protein